MKIFNLFSRNKRDETEATAESLEDPLLNAILKDTVVDRDVALSIPVISSSVNLICDTFAMIPFKLYKTVKNKDKLKAEEVYDDPRVRIINDDTKDKLDGFQMKRAMCEDYLLGKGGYAYIKKTKNQFSGLFYVEDKEVTINKNYDPIYKSYKILIKGEEYDDYNFIKLLRNTKDGASGRGLVNEISTAIKTARQRLLYEYDLILTGGSRKGFLKSPKHLDEKSLKALKKAWEDYYLGNANTVVLNDGLEFDEASNTSKENELNEKNITFISEIKDIFHISSDYNNFIKSAIMPIATAFTTALNRDFLLEKEKESFYFAPDFNELLKGLMKERFEAYKIAIETGFKTRNEIRYMEDDDALPGLDMVNLGLGDVLLNPETGEIYVPNTNKLIKMGESGTVDKNINIDNSPDTDKNVNSNINGEGGDINAHRN